MNSNFLEVDESLFQKKFLLNNLTTAEDGDEDNEVGLFHLKTLIFNVE